MEKVNVSDNRFSTDIIIPCYDTDASFHLKPSAFMDHAQELAYLAATELHFGYDDLQKHQTVWVLSRMHIEFPAAPRWTDKTTLYTWHKGLDGLFFLRDFELRAAGDTDFADKSSVLVSCTSSWIVMNVQTRHLVRSEEVLNMVPSSTQCPDDAIVTPCGKLIVPKDVEMKEVRMHKVVYSDIDINGHTNNARYVVWAMDSIEYASLAASGVKSLTINFVKETRPGDEVVLSVGQAAGAVKTYYVTGKVEGKQCFAAQIDLAD
jgi:medium-chain acyl-[acyl-carrier-protein] hydrolase